MLMTTPKLLLLRLYNFTAGRSEKLSHAAKKALVYLLIRSKKEKYVASSRFFDPEEMR
jgi:hypothetical protein